MQRRNKAYSIIVVLLFAIVLVLYLKAPLYTAIVITSLWGFILIENRHILPRLIALNTKSVSKTLLLMFLISISLPILMASGILPALIYYVSNWMVGQNLLLSAFIISTVLSMLLGTAIGTLTILIPLFVSIAFQSNLAYPVIVGALISGAYIGDRMSPLSAGLHLVSNVTETDYRKNMFLLIKSTIVPYIITLMIFRYLGSKMIVSSDMLSVNPLIKDTFSVSPWQLIPIFLMIGLLLFKMPITHVLSVIFGIGYVMALYQGNDFSVLLNHMLNGFHSSNAQLAVGLKTSGFIQMINVILMILTSAVLNSVMEADHLMQFVVDPFVKNIKSKKILMLNTALLSLLISMVTCSQAMTSMVTGKYLSTTFDAFEVDRKFLVMAIANAGLGVVAIIPWNVNGLMVKQLTSVPTLQYLPYSYFILILTVFTLVIYPFWVEFQYRKL